MIRLYIAGAVAAAVLAGTAWWGHGRYQAGAQSVRAEYVKRDADAVESQRLLTRDRSRVNQGIDHANVLRQSEVLRAAAADRVVIGGLRESLAAIGNNARDTTTASCADERRTISALAGLVSESAGLLADGAAAGAGLEAQAAGLRDYVASVCLMSVKP